MKCMVTPSRDGRQIIILSTPLDSASGMILITNFLILNDCVLSGRVILVLSIPHVQKSNNMIDPYFEVVPVHGRIDCVWRPGCRHRLQFRSAKDNPTVAICPTPHSSCCFRREVVSHDTWLVCSSKSAYPICDISTADIGFRPHATIPCAPPTDTSMGTSAPSKPRRPSQTKTAQGQTSLYPPKMGASPRYRLRAARHRLADR
jgi:hypothetical protein